MPVRLAVAPQYRHIPFAYSICHSACARSLERNTEMKMSMISAERQYRNWSAA